MVGLQPRVLQLQVLELFILVLGIRLEQLVQVVHLVLYLFVEFAEAGLGLLLQLPQLELQLVLLLALGVECLLEMLQIILSYRPCVPRSRPPATSPSWCSLACPPSCWSCSSSCRWRSSWPTLRGSYIIMGNGVRAGVL